MFLLKLQALYLALQALAMNFPAVKTDLGTLWTDVETAVVQKAWSLSAVYQIIADAETLVTDFKANWDGSQSQWNSFVAAFKALFS